MIIFIINGKKFMVSYNFNEKNWFNIHVWYLYYDIKYHL